MLSFLKIAIPSFVIGAGVGAFGWYAFSPLLFDDVVAETLSEATVVSVGSFQDADRSHRGSGIVEVVRLPDGSHQVQLSDFEVTNGPDLEVWLSAHPGPERSADVSGTTWLSLGQLKGNIGDQAYDVPADADLGQFNSVVIWCEQFGVLFSPAALTDT